MKKKPEQPATSDADLFQQAVDGVIPIASSNRLPPARPATRLQHPSKTVPAPVVSDNWSDHGVSEVAPTSFLRVGLNNMTLRKLRRGLWPVRDEIDLHGLTVEEALEKLDKYLDSAYLAGMSFVYIEHGKGTGALREAVFEFLRKRPHISHFQTAMPSEGGIGVTIVYFK